METSSKISALKYILHFSWTVTVTQFIFIVTFLNLALYHLPLFSFAIKNIDVFSKSGLFTLLIVALIIMTFTAITLFILFAIGRLLAWPFIILIIIINALALYFMVTYQIVLDRSMIANIFNTRTIESNLYFHPDLLLYLLVFGILPLWFLSRLKIKKTNRLKLLTHALLTLLISIALIYSNATASLWIDKNASKLGSKILPWSYIINTTRYFRDKYKTPIIEEKLPNATFDNDEKMIVVLVIGETARSQNFSLYGYHKTTNPLLSQTDIITLNDTTSCSTYTTASISCMLSSTDEVNHYENLPNYLSRQDVDVIWHSNNWGEPPLTVSTFQNGSALTKSCKGEFCHYDEKLLTGLEQRIKFSNKQKIFVVLHMSGSHGPSYYSKYPPEFKIFKPVCKSVVLDECTKESLVNAYDNTILYTDYFLNKVINLLQGQTYTSTVMMYMSDHGESLGEYGLYLHGTPFSIAPDVQKKVPFLLWMSDLFSNNTGLSKGNFKQQAKHSQYHIFHSVLGAFSMKSEAYKNELDIFRDRKPNTTKGYIQNTMRVIL